MKPSCKSFTLLGLDPNTVVKFTLSAIGCSGELGPVVAVQMRTVNEGYGSKVTFFPGTNNIKEDVVKPLHPQEKGIDDESMPQRPLDPADGNVWIIFQWIVYKCNLQSETSANKY